MREMPSMGLATEPVVFNNIHMVFDLDNQNYVSVGNITEEK